MSNICCEICSCVTELKSSVFFSTAVEGEVCTALLQPILDLYEQSAQVENKF
jgi:hypothetical protein